ncbi:MAG: hypothetical protein LKJ90_00345 [Faecalibacterium sp.]|jgi:energy-coupling factor transporter ATP-binding protein EcfA2|nr:hypothetical protein [Faecalibacterium sp.]
MENEAHVTDFFLGTTTPAGFKGYFDHLADEGGRQMYLIKGGPGCGKSTLMKHLAARTAEPIQRIHCSSDPDSLDGIIFCERNAAVVDATAPHVLEPSAPGADEIVFSLYDTIRPALLQPHKAEVKALFARNSCLRGRAARYIASVGSLLLDNRRAAACCTDFEKLRRYAGRLAARLLPSQNAAGDEQIRFLSGITPQGCIFYESTVTALADRFVVFQDDTGACSRVILQVLREQALARGHSIITCPCALYPDEKFDAILIPQLRLAFLTSNPWHPCHFAGQRNIHCTRFQDAQRLACYRARMHFNFRAAEDLLQQAIALMAQAKACHDELETYYRAAVDFAAVDARLQAFAETLGLPALQNSDVSAMVKGKPQ